jgi:hypothetical protein
MDSETNQAIDTSLSNRKAGTSEAPPLPGRDLMVQVSRLRPVTSEIRVDMLNDALEGTWLFKEDEIVKGPVAPSVLMDKIENGELDKNAFIAREMGAWLAMGDVQLFSDKLIEVAKRRERELRKRNHEKQVRTRSQIRYSSISGLILLPLLLGLLIGWKTKEARPWDDHDRWVNETPLYVKLEKAKKAKSASRTAKKSESNGNGDRKTRAANGSKKTKTKKSKTKSKKLAKAKTAAPIETLSNAQVTAGLKKAKRGISACLKSEIKRNPKMPGTITIEYTVANNGTAVNVKVLERAVRNTPLPKCLQKAIGKPLWPKFFGERKTVVQAFNWKK